MRRQYFIVIPSLFLIVIPSDIHHIVILSDSEGSKKDRFFTAFRMTVEGKPQNDGRGQASE